MAKIYDLQIKNFRCFNDFSFVFRKQNVICFIGRGDSGKSTILDAISYVLSPLWNPSFYDNDFHNLNIAEPIQITATIIDIPDTWKLENKFGLFLKGYDVRSNSLVDTYNGEQLAAIRIMLTVGRDLEPHWDVVNDISGETKNISAAERARLNIFGIADYLDRHFNWSSGSPLYSLMRQEDGTIDSQNLINAVREIKASLDRDDAFPGLKPVLEKITRHAEQLGLDLGELAPSVDSRDISIKDGKLCIHNCQKIPLRLNGKGSKRLTSIAIQMATTDSKSIILVDEIEQGLEPDRTKCLVMSLKNMMQHGQIFFTTHSSEVIRELSCFDLFRIGADQQLQRFPPTLQGLVRACPDALFAKRVIVCEGATEVGLCRALDQIRIKSGRQPFSCSGVVIVDGTGNTQVDYVLGLRQLDIPVLWFCDSDVPIVNNRKHEVGATGGTIIDWAESDALEDALFKYSEPTEIEKLIDIALAVIVEREELLADAARSRLFVSVSAHLGRDAENAIIQREFSTELRLALGKSAKKNEWFKTITRGQKVGLEILPSLAHYPLDSVLRNRFDQISNWVDHV